MTDDHNHKSATQIAYTPRDPSEVARFLREQPPIVVPRRSFEAPQPPGLLAHRLLGNRVITRYEV